MPTTAIRPLVEDGFYGESFEARNAIDETNETYFMSKRATKDARQGLIVEFENAKEVAEILLVPEKENKHRYKNVCILGDDDFEIACTDRDYVAGEKIKIFKEFYTEFFRPVTKSLKIVWDEEYARIAELKIYYFDPLTDYHHVEAAEIAEILSNGFANEIQYWKDCFTNPITEEHFPFENQGAKQNSFENCGLKCIQVTKYFFGKFELSLLFFNLKRTFFICNF